MAVIWCYGDPVKRFSITMTDEQYEALRLAAFEGRRSMSAEAVARIFERRTLPTSKMAEERFGLADGTDVTSRIPEGGADRAELFKRRTQ